MGESTTGRVHPAIAAIAAQAVRRGGLEPPVYDPSIPVDSATQLRMLEMVVGSAGPEGLLLAGKRFDGYHDYPLFLVLLNSDRVAVLIEKIARLNRYFHSHHRHRVIAAASGSLEIEHHSLRGAPPQPVESLFVAGLYLAMMIEVGCRDLRLRFPDAPATGWAYGARRTGDVPTAATASWQFAWDGFESTRPLPGIDELILADPGLDLEASSVATRVSVQVQRDLSRQWRLGDVASELLMSRRTLQRRLREEGTSLTRVIADCRVAAAQSLLRQLDRSVTDIGYELGFSDTSHFTRTFSAAVGLPPSRWRSAHSAT